jgi:hypothetical protein
MLLLLPDFPLLISTFNAAHITSRLYYITKKAFQLLLLYIRFTAPAAALFFTHQTAAALI